MTELTEIAAEIDAALIVVGTRGRGRLASALLGSVSQTLVEQAPCPVMIVPANPSADTPRRSDRTARERSTIVVGTWTAPPSRHWPPALPRDSPTALATGW